MLEPARLYGWQGGPPAMRSISSAANEATSSVRLSGSLRSSCSARPRKLARWVSTDRRSWSTATTTVHPALSKPRLRPPAPLKRSTAKRRPWLRTSDRHQSRNSSSAGAPGHGGRRNSSLRSNCTPYVATALPSLRSEVPTPTARSWPGRRRDVVVHTNQAPILAEASDKFRRAFPQAPQSRPDFENLFEKLHRFRRDRAVRSTAHRGGSRPLPGVVLTRLVPHPSAPHPQG